MINKADNNLEEKETKDNIMKISSIEKRELITLKDRFNVLLLNVMENNDFDLSIIYPKTSNLDELYEQINYLKKCLDSFRPLNKSQLKNLQEAFDVEYTYESNRIEGNTLTLMETDLVINKGITVNGKSMQEHLEAINHQYAINLIREFVDKDIEFNKDSLLKIHSLILQSIDHENAGFYRRDRVRISGSRHVCPNPLTVPRLMEEYFLYYQENKDTLHPVSLAANMHEKLVTIHPFIDGNGRTARLVMNLILLKNGYPITILASDKNKRLDYYNSLEQAKISTKRDVSIDYNDEFKKLIADYVKDWLFKYLNMFTASINDESKDKGYYFYKKIEPYL